MNPIESKKKGKGRNKIEIKLIEKEANRQVCFSKRRKGLFKKANELCTLCGAEVAIIVFSIAGKPYSFGHPSVDHVLQRFGNVALNQSEALSSFEPMNQELVSLCGNLEEEIKKGRDDLEVAQKALSTVSNPFWWDMDLNLMGMEELREYQKVLLQLQSRCNAQSMAEVGEEDHLLLQQQWQNYELAECD